MKKELCHQLKQQESKRGAIISLPQSHSEQEWRDGRRYNEMTRIKQEWFFIPEQLIEFSLKQPRHS